MRQKYIVLGFWQKQKKQKKLQSTEKRNKNSRNEMFCND